jgi:hypothetical protein
MVRALLAARWIWICFWALLGELIYIHHGCSPQNCMAVSSIIPLHFARALPPFYTLPASGELAYPEPDGSGYSTGYFPRATPAIKIYTANRSSSDSDPSSDSKAESSQRDNSNGMTGDNNDAGSGSDGGNDGGSSGSDRTSKGDGNNSSGGGGDAGGEIIPPLPLCST